MNTIILKRILILCVAFSLVAIDAILRSETEYDLNPIISPLYWSALYLVVMLFPKPKISLKILAFVFGILTVIGLVLIMLFKEATLTVEITTPVSEYPKLIEEFYMGGEIKKRYYFNENNDYEGVYESWFKNGEIKAQYFYKNGVLEGDFMCVASREAYKDSVITKDIGYEYGSYKNGLLDGRYQMKGRDGSLGKDGFFKNGKREGLWKVYHWNPDGLSMYSYSRQIRMKLVYKDGIVYSEECFDKNGYQFECN